MKLTDSLFAKSDLKSLNLLLKNSPTSDAVPLISSNIPHCARAINPHSNNTFSILPTEKQIIKKEIQKFQQIDFLVDK